MRGLLKRLVARNRGNGEQFDFWMMGSEQYGDGIVVAWVAVQDDFVFHGLCFQTINAQINVRSL
jgi:hypothetical protein